MGRLPTALSPSVAAAGNQTKQVSRRSQFVVPFLPDHSSSSCRPTLPLVGRPVAIWAASRLTVNKHPRVAELAPLGDLRGVDRLLPQIRTTTALTGGTGRLVGRQVLHLLAGGEYPTTSGTTLTRTGVLTVSS
jgi:hypothetical protein